MEASCEELERSILIFGSFVGGKPQLTGREFIDGERLGPSIRFQMSKLLEGQLAS
jgi:hypothetical protein